MAREKFTRHDIQFGVEGEFASNFKGSTMTLLESDLLAAIKALLESSQAMSGGNSFNTEDMVRYQKAVEWAKSPALPV